MHHALQEVATKMWLSSGRPLTTAPDDREHMEGETCHMISYKDASRSVTC